MRIYYIIFFSFFITSNLNNWEYNTSVLAPTKIIKYNNNIIGATSGGFMVYDTINHTFSNDISAYPECLEVSDIELDSEGELWILCQNGTIFKENSNLSINHLDIDNAYEMVLTDESIFILYSNNNQYGIIQIDIYDNEIIFKDYYEGFASQNIDYNNILVLNNILYVLTDEGVYWGDLNDNLKFISNWNYINLNNSYSDIIDILKYSNRLVFIHEDEINFINNDAFESGSLNCEIEFSLETDLSTYVSSFNYDDIELYILTSDKILSIDSLGSLSIVNEGPFENATSLFIDNSIAYIGYSNQGFWSINDQVNKCTPNTLISKDIEAIKYDSGQLYGVSRDGVFIYDDISFINMLSLKSGNSFLTEQGNCNFFEGTQLDYVPGNKISSSIEFYDNKIYIPNSGILPDQEVRGGLIVIDSDNLSLSSIVGASHLDGLGGIYYSDINNGYLTINQVIKDRDNKIWIVNPYAETTDYLLRHFNPLDNSWGAIETPNNTSYLPQEIAFDQWNRIWVAFRNETTIDGEPYSEGGIKLVTSNGNWIDVDNTEALPGDDPNVNVWSLDFGKFEGNDILWLLTSNGIQGYSISGTRIDPIYPIDFFTNIPFSKGDKIRVDSQNNVWVTTSHSGVRVIKNDISFWPSPEGITKENSDILSNVVRDIAFDYENGRVFFATDKGISSLGVPFKNSDNNKKIGVSPNPFIIGESQFLMIDNICSDSKIKIMTLEGAVVELIDLPYNENRFNWDGRDKGGRFLDSGIYFVVIENDQCGNGITKIAIIK